MSALPTLHLICHPACRGAAAHTIAARIERRDGGLHVCYSLSQPGMLRIPPQAPTPTFTDGLWQHTCLELFVGHAPGTTYREFNLSPSGQWAAYAFSDYRLRNPDWQPTDAPSISVQQTEQSLTLSAHIPASLLPTNPVNDWHIGVTAVLETSTGELSYWALAHADEKPDFHRRASFVARLANDILHTHDTYGSIRP